MKRKNYTQHCLALRWQGLENHSRLLGLLLAFGLALMFAFPLTAQDYVTLGTQSSQSGNTATSPVNGYFESRKIQIIYSATELINAGAAPGNIEALAWDVSTVYYEPFTDYSIKMGHTTQTAFSSNFITTPMDVVKNPFSYSTAIGFHDIDFDNVFNWNGTDNIVVEICFGLGNYLANSIYGSSWMYPGGNNSYIHKQGDNVLQCGLTSTSGMLSSKPRVRLKMPLQSCLPPTSLSVSNITAYTADFNWIASASAPADGYAWEVLDESSSVISSGTTLDTFVTTVNLDPLTNYTFHLSAICELGMDESFVVTIPFTTEPTCYPPINLTATATSINTATISWVAPTQGIPTDYEYVFSTSSTPPSEMGMSSGNATSITNVSGTANANNYLFVRSVCDEGDKSTWAGPFTIYLGYCQSVPTSNDNQGITQVTVGDLSFPVSDIFYLDNTASVANIQAGTLVSSAVTFATGYTYYTNIWIDLNDNGVFEATELVFQGESGSANPTTYNTSFSLPADAPLGQHRMRIGTADSGQSTPNPCYSGGFGVTIDLTVNVEEAPACLTPTSPSATMINLTSANLSWTSAGTTFEIEWGPSGFTQGTGTMVSAIDSTHFTLEGLVAGTNYSYYVRQVCDGVGSSNWSTVSNFYIGYCNSVPTSNDNQGITQVTVGDLTFPVSDIFYLDNTASVANIHAGTLVTSAVTFATGYTYHTNIWIDLNDNGIFEATELLFQGESASANPTTYNTSFSLATDAPQGQHRMRIGTADSGQSTPNPCYSGSFGVTIDLTVNIAPPPTCLAVPTVSVSNIESTSVTITWEASTSNPANGYAWEVRNTSNEVVASGTTTELTAPATGLTATTTYTAYVRAICDDSDSSTWTNSLPFTTTCAALDIPYTQNFDAVTTPALPMCYSIENLNGDSKKWVTSSSNSQSTPNCMYIAWNSSMDMNDWFYLPGLNLSENTSYRLQYSFRIGGSSMPENLEVYYGNAPQSSAMTFELANHFEATNASYATFHVDFIPESTGIYYIGFHGYSDEDMYFIAVDDISVTLTPECVTPSNLEIDALTATSATISWTTIDPIPDGGYEWYIEVADGAQIDEGTTDSSFVSITNLMAQTDYTFYVKVNCTTDWTAVNFSTPCAAIENFPFIETFENDSPSLDCWSESTDNPNANWFINTGSTYGDIPNAHSGENNVALEGIGEAVLFSPAFNLTSLMTTGAELNFWYANPDFLEIAQDELRVYYKTSADGDWTLIPGAEYNTAVLDWTEVTLVLPEISADYYLAFEGYADAENLVIDDVMIRQVASSICEAPTNVVVNVLSPTEVEITWVAPQTAPAGGYIWTLYNADNNEIASGTSSDTSTTLSELEAGTTYFVTITSVCGDENESDPSDSVEFTTEHIAGCMDENACNYNPNATVSDDSCLFDEITWYLDADGDGFGNANDSTTSCVAVEGYVANSTDCDDNDNTVWQSATLYIDADGDGYHGETEVVCYGNDIPDGYSATTEGEDCDDNDNTAWQSATLYIDADGDGYHGETEVVCYGNDIPDGYSATTEGEDCDDSDNSQWSPTAIEVNVTLPVTTICDNDSPLTLSGGTPANGVWSGQSVVNGVFNPAGLAAGHYTITYSVEGDGACLLSNSASADIEVDDCTSIETVNGNSIAVYPTYTSNYVTVAGNHLSQAVIIDMSGKQLAVISLKNSSVIDMQSLAQGIYFLHISSENHTEVFKVVKVN